MPPPIYIKIASYKEVVSALDDAGIETNISTLLKFNRAADGNDFVESIEVPNVFENRASVEASIRKALLPFKPDYH